METLKGDHGEGYILITHRKCNGVKTAQSFKEASSTGVELQLNERKKTLNDEINAIFHIHEDYSLFIKRGYHANYKAFETALNKNFLLEDEKEIIIFLHLTQEKITKGDIKARYRGIQSGTRYRIYHKQ